MEQALSISHFPLECSRFILTFLSFADIGRFMTLSKELYSLSRSSAVWNSLYYRKWPGRMNRGGYRSQESVGNFDWLLRFRSRLEFVAPYPIEDRWCIFTETSRNVGSVADPVISTTHAAVSNIDSNHSCDINICTFIQVAQDEFRCDYSGVVHVCEPCRDGFACSKSIESVNDSLWVCPISARSFQFSILTPTIPTVSDSESEQSVCPTLKRQRRYFLPLYFIA